jgi:hypothetical protein
VGIESRARPKTIYEMAYKNFGLPTRRRRLKSGLTPRRSDVTDYSQRRVENRKGLVCVPALGRDRYANQEELEANYASIP